MKIIGLLPVRNEEWVLPVTLPQLKRFVDEFIVLDGGSTDRTVEIVRAHGGAVIPQEGTQARYGAWRQALLDAGRAAGGTHFVWLDADEALTTPFLQGFRERLNAMCPGQKLTLDWLCLWKHSHQLRVDDCVWTRSIKDVVVVDDGTTNFDSTLLHEGRTPGPNTSETSHAVPRDEGAILHFQFAPFARFQMKQAFMRCREWVLKTGPAWEINDKYAITKDDHRAKTKDIPVAWLEGMSGFETIDSPEPGLYFADIKTYFATHGAAYFEPLDIWHVPELLTLFTETEHRQPRPAKKSTARQRLGRRIGRRLKAVFSR